MLVKFIIFFVTLLTYCCLYNNNKRSKYKIQIPKKYIKIVFPLLNNRSSTEVDIILFLEAAYLIISSIIYYMVTILALISLKIATIIWIGMFGGTIFFMGGADMIREAGNSNIITTVLEWIVGIFSILVGIFVIIVAIMGRYDLILEYFLLVMQLVIF